MKLISRDTVNPVARNSDERVAIIVGRHKQHGQSKNHTLALVELDAGLSSSSHFHREREESYYFLEGQGYALIGDKRVQVQAGDTIFTEAGERHQFINMSDTKMRYLVITAPHWTPEDSFQ